MSDEAWMKDAMDREMDREFEAWMQQMKAERQAAVPTGLEQRLMARFAQEMEAERNKAATAITAMRRPFAFAEAVKTPRSASATWMALGLHAAAILVIAALVAKHVQLAAPVEQTAMTELAAPLPPPVAPKAVAIGGGGGHPDHAPVTQGHLPKFAAQQIVPPAAPPKIDPKLAVEPTVVVQPNLKMANNSMPDLGVPNSNLKGFSLGNGTGGGIGSGNGAGIGPGSGGNTGGGVFHIGGSVLAPKLVYSIDPEFSEEARKAKFSGNVQVYLWVDEKGNPSHVRVVRGVGMGLDEKAVEAVRQYRFRPATQNGRPVPVDMYIDVSFNIY